MTSFWPRFAVYRNASPGSREEFPFFVDVQTDLFDELETRVVIPLAGSDELTAFPTQFLMPVVEFLGKQYAVLTPQLAGIAKNELGPRMGSLADDGRAITNALDFLLRGL